MIPAIVSEVNLGVNEPFIKFSYGGLVDLIVNNENGLFNATYLCRQSSDKKQLNRYNEHVLTKKLEKALKRNDSIILSWSYKKNGSVAAGRYFHPAMFLDLAFWLSPIFYVHSAVIMIEFFNTNDRRKQKLRLNLFDYGEKATCELIKAEPPRWCVRFDSFKVEVNECGWFNPLNVCLIYRKTLNQFEGLKSIVALRQYLGSRNLLDGVFYHPLLFLRLAVYLSEDIYVKCARLVFCCDNEQLSLLFRRQIAAAASANTASNCESLAASVSESVAAPAQPSPPEYEAIPAELSLPSTSGRPSIPDYGAPSDVGSGAVPNQQTIECEELPAGLGRPSTSFGLLEQNCRLIVNDSDDDSDDSVKTVDMGNATDNLLTRKVHDVELNRLRRELERKIESENRLRAELEREQKEKQEALVRVRVQVDEIETLRQQLEDLDIEDVRNRILRKRPSIEARTKDLQIAKLEGLVLFLSVENTVYAYRRKFEKLVPAILKKLDKVVSFIGWFVTDSAVLQYSRCQEIVRQKAAQSGQKLNLSQNEIKLVPEGSHRSDELVHEASQRFDLQGCVLSALRLKLEVIEADVRILSRLFNKPTYQEDRFVAPAESTFLAGVYKWMQEQHAYRTRLAERYKRRRN
ncbi:hypothetical protein V9T40_007813 [Parthenolecanium corni]|uniref:KilA-N domain-containing protein n=1 Tax=Parthenolecanium corni TaxID=536013 RepID=A0AAN9THS6_9HEMI